MTWIILSALNTILALFFALSGDGTGWSHAFLGWLACTCALISERVAKHEEDD